MKDLLFRILAPLLLAALAACATLPGAPTGDATREPAAEFAPALRKRFEMLKISPRNNLELVRDFWRLQPQIKLSRHLLEGAVRERKVTDDEWRVQDEKESALEKVREAIYGSDIGIHVTAGVPIVTSYKPEQLIPGVLRMDEYGPLGIARESVLKWLRMRPEMNTLLEDIPEEHSLIFQKETELRVAYGKYFHREFGRLDGKRLQAEIREGLDKVYKSYEGRYPQKTIDRLKREDERINFRRNTFWKFVDPVTGETKLMLRAFNGGPDLKSVVNPKGWRRRSALLPLEKANGVRVPERALYGKNANVIELGRLTEDLHVLGGVETAFGAALRKFRTQKPLMIYAECFPTTAQLFIDRYGFKLAPMEQPKETRIIRISGKKFRELYGIFMDTPPVLRLPRVSDAPLPRLTQSDRVLIFKSDSGWVNYDPYMLEERLKLETMTILELASFVSESIDYYARKIAEAIELKDRYQVQPNEIASFTNSYRKAIERYLELQDRYGKTFGRSQNLPLWTENTRRLKSQLRLLDRAGF